MITAEVTEENRQNQAQLQEEREEGTGENKQMLFAGGDEQPPPRLAGRAPAPKGERQLHGTGPGCCGHGVWRLGPVDFPEDGGIMAR